MAPRKKESEVKLSLRQKLSPSNFSGMSPQMAAMVGCILEVEYTHQIKARHLDSLSDLRHNWETLLQVAELTKAEYAMAEKLYRKMIEDNETA